MTAEEFDNEFVERLDTYLAALADSPEIDPEKFFNMTILLENIRFFSPVLYGVVRDNLREE